MATSGVTMKYDRLKQVFGGVEALTTREVLVGYPDDGSIRKEAGAPTNAAIAFIQEHGSPAANIPARPFMIPGVTAIRDRVVNVLVQGLKYALAGDAEKAQQTLDKLGLIGVSGIQRAITVGAGWPPLAPATLAARRARGVKRTRPLIDTGQLRAGVKYVIRKKPTYISILGHNVFKTWAKP